MDGKRKISPMRLIDVDKLLKAIHNTPTTYDSDEYPLATQLEGMAFRQIEILELIEKQPIVNEWNKLTFRPLTEEEKEDYSNQEWTYIIDGLPDLGEEVLVTDGKHVWIDSFHIDDFVYLSGTDNEVDGVKAWMELPNIYENPELMEVE